MSDSIHISEGSMDIAEPVFATRCLICDEDIPVCVFELGMPKICEKCKAAVMRMRNDIDESV